MEISSEPLPRELLAKCLHWVSAVNRQTRLDRRLPSKITSGKSMPALMLVPVGKQMMASKWAACQLRVGNWIAGLVIFALAWIFNWWVLLGAVVIVIFDRCLKRREKQSWEFLAAILLALEMLANDFAGWGRAYPAARERAIELLQAQVSGSEWLQYYIPLENPDALRLLAPEHRLA